MIFNHNKLVESIKTAIGHIGNLLYECYFPGDDSDCVENTYIVSSIKADHDSVQYYQDAEEGLLCDISDIDEVHDGVYFTFDEEKAEKFLKEGHK